MTLTYKSLSIAAGLSASALLLTACSGGGGGSGPTPPPSTLTSSVVLSDNAFALLPSQGKTENATVTLSTSALAVAQTSDYTVSLIDGSSCANKLTISPASKTIPNGGGSASFTVSAPAGAATCDHQLDLAVTQDGKPVIPEGSRQAPAYVFSSAAVKNFFYVADTESSSVTVCRVFSTTSTPYALAGCKPATVSTNAMTSSFDEPTGVAVDDAGKLLLVANKGSDTVSVCSINKTTGALSGCVANTGGFNQPSSLSWDGNATKLYIANKGLTGNSITECSINPTNKTLTACTAPSISSFPVQQASANAVNVLPGFGTSYAASIGASGITVCSYTGTGSSCGGGSSSSLPNPVDAVPFLAGSSLSLYLAYANGVDYCSNATTDFPSSCSAVGSSFSQPQKVVIVDSPANPGDKFALVSNAGDNSLTQCSVNTTTGALSSCATVSGLSGLRSPNGMSLYAPPPAPPTS